MKISILFIGLFFVFQIQANYFNLQQGGDLSNSVVMLQDSDSHQCFRLQSGTASSGERIKLDTCDQDDEAQQFHVTRRSDGSYKVVSLLDRQLCVDAVRSENGDIVLWSCHPDDSSWIYNQKVFFDKISRTSRRHISFKNNKNPTYMDVDGNDKVIQTPNANNAIAWKVLIKGQDFGVSLDNLDDAVVMIKDVTGRQCFRVNNGNAFSGNTIELNNCNDTDVAQQFHITKRSGGTYKVVSMLNKQLCIDAASNSDILFLWICHYDNHGDINNQKVWIGPIGGISSGMTMSFKNNGGPTPAYIHVDGNDLRQTTLPPSSVNQLLWYFSLTVPRFILINEMKTNISIVCDKKQITLASNQTGRCYDSVRIPAWNLHKQGHTLDEVLELWCATLNPSMIVGSIETKIRGGYSNIFTTCNAR